MRGRRLAIPERQLRTWSSLGAQARSKRTYDSIRGALAEYRWPAAMGFREVYLQGSYRNHTNIAGDSDVDVVVECKGMFYTDLSDLELRLRGVPPPGFSWWDFQNEVFRALAARYAPGRVRAGDKCIHVGGGGDRLNADVVPCCEYRRYRNGYAEGIAFRTRSGVLVVNYPELHYERGTDKNARYGGSYKRMIRVFKNARNATQADFPSYFLECLLHNVDDDRYSGSHSAMFAGILVRLIEAKATGSMAYWRCQNGQQAMFGNGVHQVDLGSAHRLVDGLTSLWHGWR